MKKNDFDFSIPNRQSYVAILMLLGKTFNIVVRQLFPILLVVLVGGAKNKLDFILYLVIGVSVLTMVYSIINFFRTYFIVEDNELVLYSGVFTKKRISIPFSKIQTINFEQNIIHQLFSVLRLKVDTAGSEKNEFEFQALETDRANALRDLVMEEKRAITVEESDSNFISDPSYRMIMNLEASDLIKVGLTENHLRSGGLIFIFFFWIYSNLQDVGVDVDEYSQEIPEWELGLGVIAFLVSIFLIISVVISMVRMVVKFYDLRFLRSAKGFKIESGLFTRREVSAMDHKIQHISWSDNLLRKLIGFKNLSLNQASSVEMTTKQNIKIPGCNMGHIREVVDSLFGRVDFDNIQMNGINYRYFLRFAVIMIIVMGLISGGMYYFESTDKIIYVIVFGLYLILNRYIAYRKKEFGYDSEILFIKGGIFGDKAEILPIFKIQALELHQTPYQSRNLLCSLTLYTASGKMRIPYIDLSFGKNLSNIFLKKIEKDHRKWM